MTALLRQENDAWSLRSAHAAARRGPLTTVEAALLDFVRPGGTLAPALTGPEWERVVALAVREQVSPLVLAALRERHGAAPASALTALEQVSLRTAAHGAAAYAQLTAVLQCLRAAGVAAALIKGAALARFAYGDSALRPFNDLDLLISRRDYPAADRAVREAGYVTLQVGRRSLGAGEQVYWDPSWRHVPIDLHWRFDADPLRLGLDYDAMLRRACAGTIDAEPVLVLSPADTLVALSAHFVKHLWGSRPRLRYLRDMAEVVRRHRVDWGAVASAAVEAPRARSPLRLALAAAACLTDASVPAEVFRALAPSRGTRVDRYLRGLVCRRILRRDTPFAALIQVAAVRWLDRDAWDVYPRLTAAVLDTQGRRVFSRLRRHRRPRGRQAASSARRTA